jgi:hypothetical protein
LVPWLVRPVCERRMRGVSCTRGPEAALHRDWASVLNDRIAAHERPRAVESVHRAAHAAAHAVGAAEEFGDDIARGDAPRQGVNMLTTGADDEVRRLPY